MDATHRRTRPVAEYAPPVLEPGDALPDARVWRASSEDAVALSEVVGRGLVLLCFYLWDWSPT